MGRLFFRPPLDWESLLAFLAPRATPGVETVTGDCYRRTYRLGGSDGTLEVRPGGKNYLELEIDTAEEGLRRAIARQVRRLLDLSTDSHGVSRRLRRDPLLARWVEAYPGLRVPGAWDGFELTVRAILGQQVTVKAATTLAGRLAARYGRKLSPSRKGLTTLFPTPEVLSRARMTSLGLPRARAAAIRALARAVTENRVALMETKRPADEEVHRLQALPGIGAWTAQYVAMRALADRDAFPHTDLGLVGGASLPGRRRSSQWLLARSERWRPYRAYAAMYLWKAYAARQSDENHREEKECSRL